jgi:hypothetical protein
MEEITIAQRNPVAASLNRPTYVSACTEPKITACDEILVVLIIKIEDPSFSSAIA